MNIVGVKSLVSDLHPGSQGTHRREVFDSEADRFCSRGEAEIASRCRAPPRRFPTSSSAGEE